MQSLSKATPQELNPNTPGILNRRLDDFSDGASTCATSESASASWTASDLAKFSAVKHPDQESRTATIPTITERQMYPIQAYRTGGTAVITKGRAEALSKRREVTAAHDHLDVHAVNLKLARK